MLNDPSPEDEYVFYDPPGDFGGCSAVSAETGLSVFGGSIIWGGSGEITYPDSWRSPLELGEECSTPSGVFPTQGYDLVGGTALDADSVSAAIAVVSQTAVPAAFLVGGYNFNVVVLRYPRTVGVFDPTTAEWIVLWNGGWLE
ncbi:MAG: hypothetical protein JRF63_01635 [Deltaproteobacteria bacterium]|nr:hypothetical protein [Deltaproteobacteria bacterium]